MTIYINCVDNSITFNKKNYLLRAAKRLGLTWVRDYTSLVGDDQKNPEYVLNVEPYGQFITGTRWTGIWEIDLMIDRQERSATDWAAAQTIFLGTNFIPEPLSSFRDKCVLLYHGADPELHRRIPEIEQVYDFVICGSMGGGLYAERTRLCDLLTNEGFSCMNYATGYRPWDYVKNINTARVQFIRSMGKDYTDGEIAQRFFETMMIGPVLAHYLPEEMTNLNYKEGFDYVCYRSDEELLQKMKILLAHPKMRDIIAENGRKKTLAYHTYEHRLVSIISYIKAYERDKISSTSG